MPASSVSSRRPSGVFRPLVRAAAVAAALGLTTWGAGVAAAEPELPTAGSPMVVAESEFGYVATHDITKELAQMRAPEAIASLPVPEQYRPANLGLAEQFDLALAGALAEPGGCLQVVLDPAPGNGNLFNYGFFAVAGQYCP